MILPEDTAKVGSKEELEAFLDVLLRDHTKNGKSWENADLDSYFQALKSWLEDSDGYYTNRKEDPRAIPPWRRMADALAAARIYE
jgi:hypothetical protein